MGKLREEMKVFTRDWNLEPTFENTTLVFMVILHVAVVIGMVTWIFSYLFNGTGISSTILSLSIGATIIILSYTLFISLWKFSQNNYVTFHDLKVSHLKLNMYLPKLYLVSTLILTNQLMNYYLGIACY